MATMTTEIDRRAQDKYARRIALEEAQKAAQEEKMAAREAGRAEGVAQANIEAARKLKNAGISVEIISQCTGLSVNMVSEQ